uniref:bifunctional lytic transglycosylase/C40 family peptidase n=1 Tax=Candidatus Enterococcus willemsii TaxID=1857215 RepID=UPI00403F064A
MKWKLKLLTILTIGLSFFSLLTFVAIFTADEPDTTNDPQIALEIDSQSLTVSEAVLAHKPLVEKYAKKEKIEDYINILLAIIEVESGGNMKDVMQSSESKGLPPNTLTNPEESIAQGVSYFSELVRSAESLGVDQQSVIQAYNYGGGFLPFVAKNGKKYSFELAEQFSKEQANGQRVTYKNDISVPKNGGWRYNYGNMFYVLLVNQYLEISTPSEKFDDKTVQKIMDEALKYEGYPYVFGGSNPNTSFDCSGITQWSFQKAGITLPRTAQAQYDVSDPLPLSEAKPGDLVFFHSTYETADYVTHVGIYVGNNRMYNAGDPIGYADLTDTYWQQHLIGAGRINLT